jgi:hypothetical protein
MLHQLLHEIEQANGPITIQELSQRLHLDPGVVADMVAFWVRKGRLVLGADTATPPAHHCGSDCQGTVACHFIARLPEQFAVRG